MTSVMRRILAALNAHDLDAFVACFAPGYRSEQPAHPARAFIGSDQVRRNWAGVFSGVPDFHAELLTEAALENVEVGEWRWTGHHTDGSAFAMAGVIVVGVEADEIVWGRLYMEPVEEAGVALDEMVERVYKPPPS